jgi:hypothetical protein
LGGSFFMRDVYERHVTEVEPRSYRLTASACPFLLTKRNHFTPVDLVQPTSSAVKMSHRSTKVSPHVEARILLTTVAGRSSMDRLAEGTEHMVIETLLFIAFVVVVGAAVVKAYEWYHDVLYGPYMQGGSIETGATMIAISLHPWIARTPRSDNGLAFNHSHHPETHNYWPPCTRKGLAAPRRPSLDIQKIHRLVVGVAKHWQARAFSKGRIFGQIRAFIRFFRRVRGLSRALEHSNRGAYTEQSPNRFNDLWR